MSADTPAQPHEATGAVDVTRRLSNAMADQDNPEALLLEIMHFASVAQSPSKPRLRAWSRALRAILAREAALREEVERLRVDANRYRWLRARDSGPKNFVMPGLFVGQIPENLILTAEHADAAIDAAIRAIKMGEG